MGNCCNKNIVKCWKQTPVKNVENKTLDPDENLDGSDGYYESGAIPMKAMVFVTPKYIRKFPKFTMPPFFRVSKSTSTENFNQSSDGAGISSNPIQVTQVSSSVIQHFTVPEVQQSNPSKHTINIAQDSSEYDQRFLDHDSCQSTVVQSPSETVSRHRLLELEKHQSTSAQNLSNIKSVQHLLDSKTFRRTLPKKFEITELEGKHEVCDGTIVFLPPKYVKNFLESTRPPSFGVQLTNSNSTEKFNQTSAISSNQDQITPVSPSAAESEYQESVSSEHALNTGHSSESYERLSEHDQNQTTS